MIYRIEVWSRLLQEALPAGEMVCDIDARGKGKGAFRYFPGYLEHPEAFSFDPVSLPLQSGAFSVDHPGIFNVFEDSLPDDWGRRLLVRKHQIPLGQQNLPNLLLALGSSGLGCLSFVGKGKPGHSEAGAPVMQIPALVEAAEAYERGETRDTVLALLFGAASSPGGARPKALVHDNVTDTQYMAKFPSVKDTVDVVRIEAATLNLAERAGLVVPERSLLHCGSKTVLLVKRFDVVPGGRRHMISMLTLLKATGYYQCRYADIIKVLRQFSRDPAKDMGLLFRQMVFNGVVGNTDDHLKNFWMLYGHGEGWRLSPSFDLLPDVAQRGEHVLFFDLGGYFPGRRKIINLGRTWGISKPGEIVDQVFEVVKGWREEYATTGVPGQDIERFNEIDRNLEFP